MLTILTYNEYLERTNNGKLDEAAATRLIKDATLQIESVTNGRLSKEYAKWTPDNNELQIELVKKAVSELTDYFDISGKMFLDQTQNGGGQSPFYLQASARNANWVKQRPDIINLLSQAGIYTRTRLSADNDIEATNEIAKDELFTELIQKLNGYFFRTDGSNYYNDTLINFPNTCELNNVGDITGNEVQDKTTYLFRRPIIKGYRFDGDIAGTANKANEILINSASEIYKKIEDCELKDLPSLRQEIFNAIAASDKIISENITYDKGWVGIGTTDNKLYDWYESLIEDNLNNLPVSEHPEAWKKLPFSPIDMSVVFNYIDEYLNKLTKTKIDVGFAGEVYDFANAEDFEAAKAATGTTDADWAEVSEITEADIDNQINAKLENYYTKADVYTRDQTRGYVVNYTDQFFYKKEAIDTKLNDYYTKTEEDTKLNNYYTKEYVDNNFASMTNFEAINEDLANKMDISDFGVYESEMTGLTVLSDQVYVKVFKNINRGTTDLGMRKDQYQIIGFRNFGGNIILSTGDGSWGAYIDGRNTSTQNWTFFLGSSQPNGQNLIVWYTKKI